MSCTLVTGASSGIGREFAREFARRGSDLVLVARSGETLRELSDDLERKGVAVHLCAEDLGDPESPSRIYEYCRRKELRIGLIVNCAGFGFAGRYGSMAPDLIREMLQVNAASTALITRLFLPGMVARKSGGIINVSSLSGFQGVALIGLYSATKAFLLAFTESLHEELKDTGIKVVAVCPGYVDTDFHARAGQQPEASMLPLSGAGVVVKAAIRGLLRNRAVVFPTVLDALLVFLQRFLPRSTVLKMAAFLAPLREK